MKNLLFPHAFQLVGWVMFVPSLLMGALVYFGVLSFAGSLETVVNDSVIIGIALGALFVVCSKERVEDEMTRSIRLASLLNSIYVYVTLLIGCTILLNSVDFLAFAVFNMVLLPIIFVFNFRTEMHRYNKMCDDEK